MIVTKIHSGLGNQMLQYAIARSLSLKNNTGMLIDLSVLSIDKRWNYELNVFKLQSKITSNFKIPLINKLAVKFGLDTYEFHYYEDKIWEFNDQLLTDNGKYIYLSGYWGWPQYFKHAEQQIRKDFELKFPLEINCKKWVDLSRKNDSVSLHIRRGDYASDDHASIFFGTLSIKYYQDAISYLVKHLKEPHFLIFSNDHNWVKQYFIPQSGLINYSIVQDSCFSHPAEELILMSYCKHNVIANSTFSWWGAWLNSNKNKITIQPKVWYADQSAQKVYQQGHTYIPGCVLM